MANKIPLDMIHVASPCPVSWDAMHGDDNARFCEECSQFVYNLSELTKVEAEALIMAHEGKMCVRYYRRIDGTVMTKDCPVGWRAAKRHIALVGTVIAGLFLAVVGLCVPSIFAGRMDGNGGPRF